MTKHVVQPYERVNELIKSIGGTMSFVPGGSGGGGKWILLLRGKEREVPVHDQKVNALDQLYVPKVEEPLTWSDYDSDAPLVEDAFWRLVDLFPR